MEQQEGMIHPRSLQTLASEIVLRCTAKVLIGLPPDRIEAVAAPLTQGVIDMIVSQGENKHVPMTVNKGYPVFELWCRILDEIEKEIPCVANLEVVGMVTRGERRAYLKRWGGKDGQDNTKGVPRAG